MSNLISFIIKHMQVDAKYSTCKATRKSRYSNHFKPFNHNGSKELWCKFWKLKETNNLVLTILTTESVNCVFQAEIENFWGHNMRYMAQQNGVHECLRSSKTQMIGYPYDLKFKKARRCTSYDVILGTLC